MLSALLAVSWEPEIRHSAGDIGVLVENTFLALTSLEMFDLHSDRFALVALGTMRTIYLVTTATKSRLNQF